MVDAICAAYVTGLVHSVGVWPLNAEHPLSDISGYNNDANTNLNLSIDQTYGKHLQVHAKKSLTLHRDTLFHRSKIL